MKLPRIVIAAPNGSSGKTTITLGLLSAFKKRGIDVQPFKVGADYIDPQLHTAVVKKQSRNIDSWLMDEKTVNYLFQKNASEDLNIIEGVCGLFDSAGPTTEEGSTAHIAKILKAPVILVVNAIGSFRSLAAEVAGFAGFDKDVFINGVILNNIGSLTHYKWTKKFIEQSTNIPVLGFLPFDEKFKLKERHLGLIPAQEQLLANEFIENLGHAVEENINLDKILKIAKKAPGLKKENLYIPKIKNNVNIKVAIAKDKAFNFYYQDNIDLLSSLGAQISFFSPLNDSFLPKKSDLVYIGGGFPEFFAKQLSVNETMISDLQSFALKGKKIYAECGGMMYLSKNLKNKDGNSYKMAGILPFGTKWSERLKISFLQTSSRTDNLLGKKRKVFKGHEFHMYEDDSKGLNSAWDVKTHKGRKEGYAEKNILASFIHRHFWSDLQMAQNLLS